MHACTYLPFGYAAYFLFGGIPFLLPLDGESWINPNIPREEAFYSVLTSSSIILRSLSSAVLERFETAVLDMDEPAIAAACPLLAPLELATQGQELYLGFARRALEAELESGVGDGASPATQHLPAIYNVAAAFLRR